MTKREEILRAAMELSESDRLLLATELLDSVSEDTEKWSIYDPLFVEELESRVNDNSPGIPWEEVRLRLQSDLQA